MTSHRLDARRALAPRGPFPDLRRPFRLGGGAAALLLTVSAAYGLGGLATDAPPPEAPERVRFADAEPRTTTYRMTGTCATAPCPAVLVARRSSFPMSDGSDWVRIVFTLDDAMWTEWRDGAGQVVASAEIPPRPPHVVFE